MQETNQQPSAPGSSPDKRKKMLIWIGVILGAFLLILALIIGGATYFAYSKVKDMGLTPEMLGDNPGVAFGKIVEATNPDIEFISSDPEKEVVTFRNRKTGETITIDFASIKAGEIPEEIDPGLEGSGSEEPAAGGSPPEG